MRKSSDLQWRFRCFFVVTVRVTTHHGSTNDCFFALVRRPRVAVIEAKGIIAADFNGKVRPTLRAFVFREKSLNSTVCLSLTVGSVLHVDYSQPWQPETDVDQDEDARAKVERGIRIVSAPRVFCVCVCVSDFFGAFVVVAK